MTVEFTFGAYFRLCRPQQHSSDLSLHRNAFWKFQGSGHPSAKYFKMVLARRELNGSSELGCLNTQPPPALLFPFPGLVFSCYILLHIAESAFRQIHATRWLWGRVNEWRLSHASHFPPFYLCLPRTKAVQLTTAPSVLVVLFHSQLSDDQAVHLGRGGQANQYCHVLLTSHINVLRGSLPDLEMWRQVRWVCLLPLPRRSVSSQGGWQGRESWCCTWSRMDMVLQGWHSEPGSPERGLRPGKAKVCSSTKVWVTCLWLPVW